MSSTIPITGYLDRFSHRPGESFTAFVSANRPGPARARLLRVVCADPNPDGPGMRLEDMSRVFATEFPAEFQPVRLGSYGHAPAPRGEGARTWSVILWMGAPAEARAVICQADETASLVLRAGSAGLEAALAWPGGSASLSGSTPLAPLAWHRVWLGADPATGRLLLGHAPLEGTASVTEGTAPGLVLPSGGTMLFAAENPDAPCRHFNGKLEAPAILTGCLTDPVATAPLASWDFAIGIGTQDITDTGPQACHGELANMPTRAVVGSRWSGAEHCWRHAPGDYAAIHFHDDDLDDCRWAPSFGFTVPEGLKSGAYALHIANAEGEDWLPLYVLPKREGPFAPIAFLASTFTYQAYANHARGNIGEAGFRERIAEWRAYPHSPDEFHAYAHSTYNRHPDGSGVAFTSRLRPVLTMRPGFLTFPDAKGSGLRHYPADSHLLAWLEAKGFAFDVITDEDLDDEGESILAPYRVVLTGSHPEYHTTGTLDALQAYTQGGGRLVYLGGNGFYWRIARDKSRPGIFELRRAEGGIRAWQAEPGEYYHATDGQMGGLWRRNRRPPQKLVGVGFSGQGKFEGTHYRRLPASHAPEHAWMFDGIEGEIIGDYGLSGGGAAGFELDRADPLLGTPANAAILARSEHPPASFVPVPEELLSHIATTNGEEPEALMRGEIVTFDTPGGGAVFSVGSITFCGSLWNGGFRGSVSQLLENVVRRFSAP